MHVIHHLGLGGAERMCATLAQGMARDPRYQVHVALLWATGGIERQLRNGRLRVWELSFKKRNAWAALALHRLLRVLRIDVLHMHDFSAGMWGRLASIFTPVRVRIITEHTIPGWLHPLKHTVVNRILSPLVDCVVAVSVCARQALIAAEGVRPELVRVIPNGIDIRPYRTRAPGVRAPARTPAVIGFVGRCSHEKGGDVFIDALALLRNRGKVVSGVLVGDGPERMAWQRRAQSLGLGAAVRFTGALEHEAVAGETIGFDIAVVPSRVESCSLALLEFMAAGLPIVATRAGGTPMFIRHGVSGLLVDSESPEQLADALAALMDAPALCARIGAQARHDLVARWSSDAMVCAYGRLYEELMGGSAAQYATVSGDAGADSVAGARLGADMSCYSILTHDPS